LNLHRATEAIAAKVVMKSKERQQRKAQDAPDNPSNSVRKRVMVDMRGILNDPENWDERLWP